MSGSILLRMFGGAKESSFDAGIGKPPAGARPDTRPDASAGADALLMDAISEFLIGQSLPVTPANLTMAHAIFSGEDSALARKLLERQTARLPVTQDWLDQNRAVDGIEKRVKRIVGKLESSLETFAQTTRNAHDAAESYTTRIAEHASGIAGENDPAATEQSLQDVLREIIAQGSTFAAAMKQSQAETQSLRAELEKARHDADVDHLTGLPNRRAFETLLDRQFREARANLEHLCVAFCDIDHFKRVNDTHGHDTGDRVIRAIGEALARITDDNCHVARQGGEEFVMLFRGKTQQEAFEKLDAVRENFGNRHFVNRSNEEPIGQITFSGGVADVFAYPNPRDALKAADEALYRAKQGGRNRIEMA